ncbi:hypothetical protein [Labilithrix luteola]|nr:hypothetical protein [Labilithrix luteola]
MNAQTLAASLRMARPRNALLSTVVVVVSLAPLACARETGGASDDRSKANATNTETRSVVDPSCPEEHGQRVDVPTGRCTAGAECTFETIGTCKPGGFVPAVPNQWECRCVEGTWTCEIVSGGYGLVPCPDAGSVDADVH